MKLACLFVLGLMQWMVSAETDTGFVSGSLDNPHINDTVAGRVPVGYTRCMTTDICCPNPSHCCFAAIHCCESGIIRPGIPCGLI